MDCLFPEEKKRWSEWVAFSKKGDGAERAGWLFPKEEMRQREWIVCVKPEGCFFPEEETRRREWIVRTKQNQAVKEETDQQRSSKKEKIGGKHFSSCLQLTSQES